MKLLVVTHAFPTLSESFIHNKVLSLIDRGVEVSVLTHSSKNDHHFYDDRHRSIKITKAFISTNIFFLTAGVIKYLLFHPGTFFISLSRSIQSFGWTIRGFRAWVLAMPILTLKPDIVHFEFSGIAVIYQDTFALLNPIKSIVSCRGTEEHIKPFVDLKRAIELQKMFAVVDKIHCVSHEMAHHITLFGAEAGKLFVNHPSIEPLLFNRKSSETVNNQKLILSVGSLRWGKGYEYAFMGMQKLLSRNINFQYVIIGGGNELEKLKYEIHALGLVEHVQLLGPQKKDAIIKYLGTADIFLQPSLSEGLSNATLEAMSFELPVVATDVGGTKEAISDGIEGFIVPPRDAIAISEAIKKLIADPALMQKMGKAGRNKILSRFTLERQTQAYLDFYEELVTK